jgi:antitoxin ParD1/3/4
MPRRTTINVSLTPEWEEFINQRLASGRYQTASEVVRDGLRLLERQEADRATALDEVRQKIQAGLDQARRGESIDGPRAFKLLKDMLKSLKA